MAFAPELTTLGYILSPDRERVLLVHRVSRAHDEQLGKFNGLGISAGKILGNVDALFAVYIAGGLCQVVGIEGARRGILGDDNLSQIRLQRGENAGCVLIRKDGQHTDEAGEVEIAVQRCA